MSKENVELVRRGYDALNSAYSTGEVNDLLPFLEDYYDPDVVLKTSGMFPETAEMHGHSGMLRFVGTQMDAFQKMWIEPQEFIEAGNRVVVPVRFGGEARHTGLEVEFSVVHVATFRDGKVARIDMHRNKAEALEAAGLSEDDVHSSS
jgi:ketosteroid isomerase-like protein